MGLPKITWFGNVYSSEGMSSDPEKVYTIKKWPEPKEKSVEKFFLQTVQFCSIFMGTEEPIVLRQCH